ncbi:hypothetical protein UFOVP141_23 [uncultured Caudovirales phage]|uniref:Uncharacterized protein n=1 Tax=uncultured Caudovirales phage TaxID=2100421 RepID=A0A6J7VL60_9CAUD|nr:hypothetical protein UFOVP141_23 [uncultured Caudovirales phage]
MARKLTTQDQDAQAEDLGNFDSVEQRDSWWRWISRGEDVLRIVLRGDEEHDRRLRFRHRQGGREPLPGDLIGIKVAQAIAKRDALCERLGRRTIEGVIEPLDYLFDRWHRRDKIAIACIRMAELEILRHWAPVKERDPFAPPRDVRRPMTEQETQERMANADRIAAEMCP